jgi:hypothetical protein
MALACAGLLLLACSRGSQGTPSEGASAAPPVATMAPSPAMQKAPEATIPPPTRLLTLPVSAYATSIAMDEEAVYLMTSSAAYRLVPGEPAHGIRLELGIGPVLTQSAFVFWSNGSIWSAPKQGGVTRELGKFPHQPQYFVSSGEGLAWVDETDEGLYTIQTFDGGKPRVLVSSPGEIRGLDMIGNAVYFVEHPAERSWRIGVVRLDGGSPEYASLRSGRAPAQLVGSDGVYYYDLDQSRVIKLSLDLRQEEGKLKDLVCSPIHVSDRIYCGCVEGLFDVSKETHQPRVLSYNRPGSITSVTSNSKAVAWVVDLGPGQLAVDMLRAPNVDGSPVP